MRFIPSLRSRVHSQDGSLPLVLLSALILAGVIAIMFGQVRTAQESVQDDRDFHEAIQYANAGAQAAFTFLGTNETEALDLLSPDDVVTSQQVLDAGLVSDSEVGNGIYEWEAKYVGDREWQIRTSGFSGPVERVIELDFGPMPLFTAALYGEEFVDGNLSEAPSCGNRPPWAPCGTVGEYGAYDEDGYIPTGDDVPEDEDNPLVAGTSGSCDFGGPGTGSFDQVLFASGGDDVDLEGCDYALPPISFKDIAARAFAQPDGICHSSLANVHGRLGDNTFANYPNDLALTDPDGSELVGASSFDGSEAVLERGNIYCFESMTWPSSHVLSIDPPSGEGAARVYIRGALNVEGGGASQRQEINAPTDGSLPDASALQLMFAGSGDLNITGNNHKWIGASIYAPNRACEIRAQTKLAGAMICNSFTIGAGGGFNFWYDARTANIVSRDDLGVYGTREEFPGTTGFDWVAPG